MMEMFTCLTPRKIACWSITSPEPRRLTRRLMRRLVCRARAAAVHASSTPRTESAIHISSRSTRVMISYVGGRTARVLEFATPITNDQNAIAVFGQANFTSIDTTCGSANVLCSRRVSRSTPAGICWWGYERQSHHGIHGAAETENQSASLVLGQDLFNHLQANTPVPEFLALPIQIAIDQNFEPGASLRRRLVQ